MPRPAPQTRAMLLLALVAAISTSAPDAQAPPPERTPRTAVVLSGGGARGAAHVGVLKVLDELRVPVDLVVGTSMGAVVGGLYSSGLTADAIEQALVDVDWADAFSDAPLRKNISFRRKQDDDRSLFDFEFGFGRGGITLPSGFIAGQKLSFLFRSLLLHTAGIDRFDDLPIPFRAVAADLSNGEMVLLDRGDLAVAMRASMSVPGVFTPVRLDGRTLVDGGIVRNLAVDVALELGAERIIAVDVTSTGSEDPGKRSAAGVLLQTFTVITDENVEVQRELLRAQDQLIVPDLTGIRSSDFDRIEDLIERGEVAARAVADALVRLSPPRSPAAVRPAAAVPAPGVLLAGTVLDSVEVNAERVHPRIVSSRIRTRPGRPLDLDLLQQDLARIYQIGEFEQVDFQVGSVDGTHQRLRIDAREKSWGPGYLRFGIELEANLEGAGDFAALVNYRRANLNRLGAEWNNFIRVGDLDSVFSEFYQPLTFTGLFFVAPQIEAFQSQGRGFDANRQPAVAESDSALGRIDFGVQFGNYGELRIGLERGIVSAEIGSGAGALDADSDLGRWRLRGTVDQLDNANFPLHGNLTQLDLDLSRSAIGADESYDKLALLAIQAGTFGRNTLIGIAQYGNSLGSDIPFYDEFQLGGFLDLSGIERGALQGDEFAHASLVYYRKVGQLPRGLGGGLYLGVAHEVGNVWTRGEDVDLGDLRHSGLLFFGVDTAFGPIYFGYGQAERGEDSFYLFLGRPF